MARAGRWIAGAAGVLCFAFLAGFVIFANRVAHYTPPRIERADGIVVLTGGKHRLAEAVRLLEQGRGDRLLISGVNRITSREDLIRQSGLNSRMFDCCVDIGYAAHDTSGNADETKAWVADKRFTKLIIVTSSYHMPRSLAELGRAMPNVMLIPFPVATQDFRNERWWRNPATARLLFFEYVKFIPSAARFGVARLFRSWEGSALADGGAVRALSL
ncbi:MAG: YdcF family protein [Hyphomicrobiaceae bacterium]|nr:MAG: YdcF family protein [Hyphomicrobiaceae bacterium]